MTVDCKHESRSHIDTLVCEFAYGTFGRSFYFRKGQKEQCIEIIYHFVTAGDDVKRRYVLQAPTGSGKSIIAMIVAGVLSNVYGMTGYILVSDLGLLDQYIRDVDKYCKEWASIKGKSNYICIVNGRGYINGACSTYEGGPEDCEFCDYCPYQYAKWNASHAKVVVCTYHYWLLHKQILKKRSGSGDPKKNEFVICDEAHNAMTIVQNMYSLSIGEVWVNHARNLETMFPQELGCYKLMSGMGKCVTNLITACETSNAAGIYKCVETLKTFVGDIYGKLKEMTKSINGRGKPMYKLDSKFYKEFWWFRNASEKLDLYSKAINGRADTIIATLSDNRKNAIMNSVDEGYLMDAYFHGNYTRGLFMSATIGDMDEFAMDLNMYDKEIKMASVPSTFDFRNSKIFYCPTYSLSRNTLEVNFPIVMRMVDAIMTKFVEYRGCIFVSSYEMANNLVQHLSPENRERVMVYKDAREKASALMRLKTSDNGVLLGPSIYEGISLDDDLCRFAIIAKVPYADTTNKLVKYKLDKFGFGRYSLSAIQNIIQAVGRGMRSETDWCTTFILDGAFSTLYRGSKHAFDDTFKSRLVPVSAAAILT